MKRKLEAFWTKCGWGILCVLCAGTVLLSALWTRSAQQEEALENVLLSTDEKLEDKAAPASHAPCDGAVLRMPGKHPVYFDQTGVWRTHPGTDYTLDAGQSVYAVMDGVIAESGNGKILLQGETESITYLGIAKCLCVPGDQVTAGQVIGLSGAWVPFEGEGHICVISAALD